MTIVHHPACGRLARFWLAVLALASGLVTSAPAQAVEARALEARAIESVAAASLLHVTLADALTGDVLPHQRIDAYQQRPDGRLRWRARAHTDADGVASFDLAHRRIEPGVPLVLRARPFGTNAFSDPVTGPGKFTFDVGRLAFRLVSGADGSVMPNTLVVLKKLLDNGKHRWVGRATSDAEGVVRFDAAGLGDGTRFVARSRSPVSGRWKTSDPVTEAGLHDFVVGNAPLVAHLVDALSGVGIPGTRLDAYALRGDRRRWVARAHTDDDGIARLDIDDLGEPGGPEVVLRTRAFGAAAFSGVYTEPGKVKFPVGTLTLALRARADDSVMANADVHLRELLDDGKTRWAMRARTDADGIVRFTPRGLGDGRRYIAKARAPATRKWHSSDPYDEPGRFLFEVGNVPLVVSLVNGVSGEALAGETIHAVELRGEGERPRWRARSTTNDDGVAVFDLAGLGEGRVYALRTRPYNAGTVQSDPVEAPGDFTFRVGTVPVTLVDGDSGEVLPERRLIAYRLGADGSKRWFRRGNTDESGTVHFDLPGVSPDMPYVIKAWNPFGEKQRFESKPIVQEGPVRFEVLADADRVDPDIAIDSPAEGAELAVAPIIVTGNASDNEELARVSLVAGGAPVPVDLDLSTGEWRAEVPATTLVVGPLALVATATDAAGNDASVTRNVLLMSDVTPPTVSITSHLSGAVVPASGFTLSGDAADDTALASVLVSVTDPVLGNTLMDAPASVDPSNGTWSLQVLSGQISVNETIAVSVRAVDEAGLEASASISLVVVPVAADVRHLVNRITFGPTFDLLEQVNASGAPAYLAQQLDADNVDDTAFETMLAGMGPVESKTDLQVFQLAHAIHSRRQLREMMTVFWDNHFNTNVNTSNSGMDNTVAYELAENQAFRANALGRFRDLLEISAKSPSMLIYLDGISSVAGAPNENYPRELLELHTLDELGDYTQTDVEEVSRVFTGWTVRDGAFHFEPTLHDTGEKTVLGQTIPAGGGVEDGELVLDILSVHPATADFICRKLSVLLVTDTPPASLVSACATEFLGAADDADQIAQVLALLLSSAEFYDPANHGAKVKTPLELVAGVARGLEAEGNMRDLPGFMRSMGMRLFEFPVPTGFDDTGDAWISAFQLVERYKTADRILFNSPGGNRTSVEPLALALSHGAVTADGVIALLLELTVGDDYTDLERQVAMDVLTDGGLTPYDPANAQEADARLRAVLGTIMSFPAFQFQ